MAKKKNITTPDNIRFGDLPAETRMKILKMQEEERKKEENRKLNLLYTSKKQIKNGLIMKNQGLWANIHAKRKRIKAGSGEKMRKPGSKGAPTAKALRDSQSKKA